MQTIGISAKITSPEALEYAAKIAADLRGRGLNVCFDYATADKLNDRGHCVAKGELGNQSNLLITFGGDGTLLSVARHAPAGVPILGVNMGTLGFLTEVGVEEFPETLERVLSGDFHAEERVAFDVSVEGNGRDHRSYRVLNDATINKSALARIVEMRVAVSGAFVSTFRADGLIVATPTGSTAYNLSAGGPIIYPTMGAIVITPICPHMLTNRPIVLPDELEVEIRIVTPNQEIFLTLDGQEGLPITADDRVLVRKSANSVTLIRTGEKNYFDVLRAKLKWGEG
jgi:NAD+ kinase